MASDRRQRPLVGTSIQFSHDQKAALVEIADGRQLSISDVVREAVREYLAADAARRVQREPIAA